MTTVNGETMRLTSAAVPAWAIKDAVKKMNGTGIRVSQSSIILFAIGKLIGLSDQKLADFAQPKPGRKPGSPFSATDDFLSDLETTP